MAKYFTKKKRQNKSNFIATSRKAEKKKHTRKRQSCPQKWKKNVRKELKNLGKEYFSPTTKKSVPAKALRPHSCTTCRFECSKQVPEDVRSEISKSFYNADRTFERKRDFICRHIVVQPVSKIYSRSYKQNSKTYFLPVVGTLQRVCKQLFLRTLDVSDKMVRCTLSREVHGSFQGTERRGKHTPAKKTSDAKLQIVRQHIESFPVMDTHCKRKDTSREFLEQDLSITKMYDLYKEKCVSCFFNYIQEIILQ